MDGGPGEPAAILRLERLAGELEFVSDNDWRLIWLTADLNGLTLEAMGSFSDVRRYLRRRRPSTELTDFRSPPLARVLNAMDNLYAVARCDGDARGFLLEFPGVVYLDVLRVLSVP